MNVLKKCFARLSRWCFGETEKDAAIEVTPAAAPVGEVPPGQRPATLKFPTPLNIGTAMQKAIADAAGVPIENVKIIPLKFMPCDCENCQRARKYRGAYMPSAN